MDNIGDISGKYKFIIKLKNAFQTLELLPSSDFLFFYFFVFSILSLIFLVRIDTNSYLLIYPSWFMSTY